jgi:hypothetical protein
MFQLSLFYVMASLCLTRLSDEGLWGRIISLYRILANRLAVGDFGETFEGLRMAEQYHVMKSLFFVHSCEENNDLIAFSSRRE